METSRRRVAVVTGGSSGIGLATARTLLGAGFRVALFGQTKSHVDNAMAILSARYEATQIISQQVDLGDAEAIAAFFGEVRNSWGPIDTLVCSAGFSPKGPDGATPFAEVQLPEWNQVLSVNLTGAMLCCQAVLPSMMAEGFGRIILIGSIAGRAVPKVAGPAYVASKAALSGLCKSIVAAAAGTAVTVNVVAPGNIVSAMTGAADSPANRIALSRIPVGRLGHPDDVAGTVRFLASEEAGFINGAVIDVNGGEFASL